MELQHRIRLQQSHRELQMLAIRARVAREEEELRNQAIARQVRADKSELARRERERERWSQFRWSMSVLTAARTHGWNKILPQLAKTPHYTVLDRHPNPEIGELIQLHLPQIRVTALFLVARCPRNGLIAEGIPPASEIDGLPITTALAAQAWRIGDPLSEYVQPPRRT